MEARFRSWWQKARKPLGVFGIIVLCILIVVLLVLIVMVYVFNVNVPGLRGKTLWDWLQLLIIPLGLAIIALVFQLANSRTEQQIAQQRYEQDQQIALDKQRQDLLQAYFDRMSELLLKEKLRSSEDDAEVRTIARVRTITVLTQLDARRIGYVFAFLGEASLMSTTSNDNVVNLGDADLRSVNWSDANLFHANLSGAQQPHLWRETRP
jgi:Pentapeptide repeats (8 copies)